VAGRGGEKRAGDVSQEMVEVRQKRGLRVSVRPAYQGSVSGHAINHPRFSECFSDVSKLQDDATDHLKIEVLTFAIPELRKACESRKACNYCKSDLYRVRVSRFAHLSNSREDRFAACFEGSLFYIC
jgi:hypothetical protein